MNIIYNVGKDQVEDKISEYSLKSEDCLLLYPMTCDSSPEGSISVEAYKVPYKKRHIEWLQNRFNEKVNGKKIKEHFSYKGQTLFYLIDLFLLWDFMMFKKHVALDHILTIIDILEARIKSNVKVISHDPHDGLFIELVKLVCNKKGVECEVLEEKDVSIGKFEFARKSPAWILRVIKGRIRFRYFAGLFRRMFRIPKKGRGDVLIPSNIRFSRGTEEDNVQFGAIIKGLKEGGTAYKVINYDVVSRIADLKNIVRKYLFNRTPFIGDYYSLQLFKENKIVFEGLKNGWVSIKDSAEFRNVFGYTGINIHKFLGPMLELVFNSLNYLVADNLNITKSILEKEKPNLVLLDHINNFYGKGFMIAAKNSKEPRCVALQHEVAQHYGCNYTHVRDEEARKKGVCWRPVPEKTCVWGPFAEKVFLEECNYEESWLEVTGNPSFDDLVNRKFNRNQILQKHSIPEDKKIVLVVSHDILCEDLYNLTKDWSENFKNAFFLVKPHPQEDTRKMNRALKNYDNIKTFSQDTDIYELMYISDCILMGSSTVGIEALIMGRPILLVDFAEDFSATIDYKNAGVALTANKENLEKILAGRSEIDKENITNFIYSQTYKKDGKSAERVIGLLKKCLASSQG